MFQKSVTIDESANLPQGLVMLKTGQFRIDLGMPPLSKLLVSIPVLLFTSAKISTQNTPFYVTSWQCGYDFAILNREYYHYYFLIGRIVSVIFLLITCCISYIYSKRMYGVKGGLITLFIVCFSPNLIAHGRLITSDIFLSACVICTLLCYDVYYSGRRLFYLLLTGVTMTLAALMKLSGIFLFITVPITHCILHVNEFSKQRSKQREHSRWITCLGEIVFLFVIAILIINICYGLQFSFNKIGDFNFNSTLFRNIQQFLPSWFPVPLPYYYFKSFDTQLAEAGYSTYLLGDFSDDSIWYYYVIAFLVKLPVPTMILLILSCLSSLKVSRREMPLLLTAIIYFLLFSFIGHKNIGLRYLLFIIPMLAIWIGRLGRVMDSLVLRKRRIVLGIIICCILALFLNTLLIWPDYIPFFNIIAGGPSQGHYYLLDSNLDWGQDLIGLKEYMDNQKISAVDLAYCGRVKPELYGIIYTLFLNNPQHRYVVISANLLWGRMYYVNGTRFWPSNRDLYASFRDRRPVAVIGHSLYVFDMEKQYHRNNREKSH